MAITRTEQDLAERAQACGLTLGHSKPSAHGQYYLRTPDGGTIGPFTAAQCRIWLAGCSMGQAMHTPDCRCGRVACVYRKAQAAIGAAS